MGLIGKVLIFGAGVALGWGLYAPGPEYCSSNLTQQIKTIEVQNGNSQKGFVGPHDLDIDYVISSDKKFDGLVFTDVQNGKSGVLVRHQSLVGPSIEFYRLDHDISPAETVPIFHAKLQREYHSKTQEYWDQLKGWIDEKVR